jgi:hypothetical protein
VGRFVLLVLLAAAAFGCGETDESANAAIAPNAATGEVDENACGVAHPPEMVVIRRLDFVGATDGITDGLDLDGRISDAADSETCGQPDYSDPDGNPGIDNSFARLLPALEAATGGSEAVASAVQRAINNGDVLVMIETQRYNGEVDDSCVEVSLVRGDGRPTVGGDGLLVSGQTFDRDTDAPSSFVPDATVADGRLMAGPVSLELPMQIAQFDLFLTLEDAVIEMWPDEEGNFDGLISGAIVVAELETVLDEIEDGTDLVSVIRTVVRSRADMDPDENGDCQRLSITLRFEATPAFFFADESSGADTSG